ncbi:MAG TPA: response regulator transcription factor [Telmatospirillum sp.]|nr:response regulator transcription factor [Telmatospirillum sp.]
METIGHILIADDHPMFREALRHVVAGTLPNHTIVEASSFDEVMAAAKDHDQDLILLDIDMPGMNGFNGLIALRNQVPTAPVVVVSADESRESVRQALSLGASGFVPKSMDREHMASAIQTVLSGEIFVPFSLGERGAASPYRDNDDAFRQGYATLTSQQRKVLEMLVLGRPNKVIAYEMNITESTVKAHVSAILHKLQVTSRTQAVLQAGKMLNR